MKQTQWSLQIVIPSLLVWLSSTAGAASLQLSGAGFWCDTLGLEAESSRVRRIAKVTAGRAVFNDEPLLRRRHAALSEALGSERHAAAVLQRSPLLLTLNLEETMPSRMEGLRQLLGPSVDVASLLIRAPDLLKLDCDRTLRPRLLALQAVLPPSGAIQLVSRSPTVLQLANLDARLQQLEELLPGVAQKQLLRRAPSLLAYDPAALARKLTELSALFDGPETVAAMVRRDPQLLTFATASLACKLDAFRALLPEADVVKLLAANPALLRYDVGRTIAPKLQLLEELLPGVELPRLLVAAPQLLEFDVANTLAPKLEQLRALFGTANPTAAGPPPASAAGRLAAAKLLASRRAPAPSRSGSGRGGGGGGRRAAAASRSTSSSGKLSALTSAASGRRSARSPSAVGLLRLASLDVAVVERRLGRLQRLLPEVDALALVSRQPSLLKRDVQGALRPRLVFLATVLGDAAAATATIVANPRLLLAGWGVLGRLLFVIDAAPGGLAATTPSSVIMAPKAKFSARYPGYADWLRERLCKGGETVGLDELERLHGLAVEADALEVAPVERSVLPPRPPPPWLDRR